MRVLNKGKWIHKNIVINKNNERWHANMKLYLLLRPKTVKKESPDDLTMDTLTSLTYEDHYIAGYAITNLNGPRAFKGQKTICVMIRDPLALATQVMMAIVNYEKKHSPRVELIGRIQVAMFRKAANACGTEIEETAAERHRRMANCLRSHLNRPCKPT